MGEVLGRERERMHAQLMVYCLCYWSLARSLAVLQDYQMDCQDALDWQAANDIQPGDLLPLQEDSLPPSNDSLFLDDSDVD